MNTRKPTKKEGPDGTMCWYWYNDVFIAGWIKLNGYHVRDDWQSGDRWLPLDAIPDPTQPTTKKGRKA